MDSDKLNIHLISDATGDTLNSLGRAAVAQFDEALVTYHRWSLIRSRLQLHRVLEGIQAEPGPVLCSLVDQALRHELDSACARMGVPLLHVLDPVLEMLQAQFGAPARHKPGRQYVLDADYFRRIDAMHYVISHDDGQANRGISDADVVLVGVSRSSKTPTCFYLANRGIKALNVPLVPGIEPPEALMNDPPCPVIGLTIDPKSLIDIRRHRLQLIGGGAEAGFARADKSDYVDYEAVEKELLWARRLCNARGWPTIDVTRRSIEETSATVLKLMDNWHAKREKPPAADDAG
ncbi:pyruvate, water dikinase regulatory protein [Acidocella sp. KAb 2-4]|uniref:pyruvate, water dikinase regulatory protein n=1 Tax=Acidocella sp. KAb 2-4 TaxID=2885158 RepID=UPI001D05F1DA|nr:pyruvate, water dikinase regulatory protein [Acidocella sp. KAb 2-4]MCB5944170.1 kinase/pyrophosphorylase [Acidocella sp. KAb 2-4]